MSSRADQINALASALEALRKTATGLDLPVLALSLDVAIAEARARATASTLSHSGPRAYTPETLAERWGCSGRHVRNLMASGELQYFRLGGKLMRISVEAISEFERRHMIRKHARNIPDS